MKEELHNLRGEYILTAIELENAIDVVLSKIFHGKYISFLNSEIILNELNLEKKINILAKTLKLDSFKKDHPDILKNTPFSFEDLITEIKKIKFLRNQFAHDYSSIRYTRKNVVLKTEDGKTLITEDARAKLSSSILSPDENSFDIHSKGKTDTLIVSEVKDLIAKAHQIKEILIEMGWVNLTPDENQ